MTRPHIALSGLAAAQLLCLALGLWVHESFVLSSLKHRQAVGASAAEADFEHELAEVLPPTRWIALVWIGGLQASVAYLILSRAFTRSSERQIRTTAQSLSREKDLLRTRNAVVFGLAKLAESRDPDTGFHLEKIACYSTRLAAALRKSPRYRAKVTPSIIRQIGVSSALHDIGKVSIADAILLKPGMLTDEERARMQRHAAAGGECIREIERRLGNSNFLQLAREIAYCHHERWDGAGYPAGLAGEAIPLSARIVAIADVYDALSSRRVYKDAFPHEKCVEIIRSEAGKQFDPYVVEMFLKIEDEFREIAERFADHKPAPAPGDNSSLPDNPAQLTPSQEAAVKELLEAEPVEEAVGCRL